MKKYILIILIGLLTASFVSCNKKRITEIAEVKTSSGIEMVLLPGGEFMMGEGDQKRGVKLSPFYIDKYEVTQEMFKKVELPNPSHFKEDKNPVEMVAWVNAAVYCNERSLDEGLKPCYNEDTWECDFTANGYRLPTEAEWEYAARGGSGDKYFFGSDPKLLKDYAIYNKNSSGKTSRVGSRKPNQYGLYDMYGNAAEWCNDIFSQDYYKNSPLNEPKGPNVGEGRIIRGGSWIDSEESLTSSWRDKDISINDACVLKDTIGFRCVKRAD
ncbi:MAG: formylglycine-generating enzyme family protein [Leptospirales bacterium]|nr:formylglycine-generating enzyme family protein [Leptospirales bacterium]